MAVRVFVSYTHDDDAHCERVLALVQRLRDDGVDARLDQFVAGTPELGWPSWMERQMAKADFVVVVCTPTYYERYSGDGETRAGLGGRFESNLIRNVLYGDPGRLQRFLPVLPRGVGPEVIPDPLRFSATHYSLEEGYERLYGDLTGQHDLPLPPLGPERAKPVRVPSADTQVAMDDARFSAEISARFAKIGMVAERLTSEQNRVIEQLSGQARALISGCPGSGKTLVAAEKALRMARAGISTLFLCHNPLLARWVAELTAGSSVRVMAFEDLVAELSGGAGEQQSPESWTNYSGPTVDALDAALARLLETGGQAQAVVVDEGQDFASDWWPLVEACLKDQSAGILYIFFDERQSLLPFRSVYPIDDWPLDLSRNCRNGGRIYEVMRRLAPEAPLPEHALAQHGEVEIKHHGPGMLDQTVTACLDWLEIRRAVGDVVAVLGGGVHFGRSVLADAIFEYGAPLDWRSAVLDLFWRLHIKARARSSSDGIIVRGDEQHLRAVLESLSHGRAPTLEDIAVVNRAAAMFTVVYEAPDASRRTPLDVVWRVVPRATSGDGEARGPELRLPGLLNASTTQRLLQMLRSDAWATSIPAPMQATFAPHASARDGVIPVYTVGEIKGLEREAVLLVMQGDAPELQHEMFVGVSRARSLLAVALDERAYAVLPSRLRSRIVNHD